LATTEERTYAALMLEGFVEADVSIVTALPESLLRGAYELLGRTDELRYVRVSNEAEMPGICAGAYLAGKRSAMIMENSGLRQACEPLTRLSWAHHVPMVLIMSNRGAFGEKNWWGHNHTQVMEPILEALRFPYWYVMKLDDIKTHISRAWDHADSSQWPVALIFGGECVEAPHRAAD
jgi:sulfopyruvate decarboxylase subunit alpha